MLRVGQNVQRFDQSKSSLIFKKCNALKSKTNIQFYFVFVASYDVCECVFVELTRFHYRTQQKQRQIGFLGPIAVLPTHYSKVET